MKTVTDMVLDLKTKFDFDLENEIAFPVEILKPYKGTSWTARVAYMQFLAEAQQSVKDDFVDKEGNPYIEFDRQQLASELEVGINELDSYLDQLIDAKLISVQTADSKEKTLILVYPPLEEEEGNEYGV